ncbi:ROK family transcriptional regulator [Leptothrix discophora]|uniref:ROK family transcriptional regulator n=2 Tax=Leptothrix discophora TaxID=89 RepID=A0ABT9G202_LEPDI|nr:ROK family transcriptional regulator [Leptothrix discophora]MDP4300431.1 ROK family transcriptional regulator [Leptothrix discophora]
MAYDTIDPSPSPAPAGSPAAPRGGDGRPAEAASRPAEAASQLRPRGSNHAGMRQYNERVVLQAIRLHGDLPKADLARLTHLSTQTVSLIVNALLEDGLLVKRQPLRGRIGQPSVPIALNPDGAYAIGVKIGRRSMDVLVIDFTGSVRERSSVAYDFPDPLTLFGDLRRLLEQSVASLGTGAERLAGIGIATPLSLGSWQALLGVGDDQASRWNEIDLAQRVGEMTDLPVHVIKDTSAACVAELVSGRGRSMHSFLYLFVDTFVGGGLVIDSQLYNGARGNAGAVGSMPLHAAGGPAGVPPQVLSAASLFNLQQLYAAAGLDPQAAVDGRALEPPWASYTRVWLRNAAQAMALATVNATCLLDLDDVVVDGVFGRELLSRLIAHLEEALDMHNWEGISRPSVRAGTIGSDARAMGGALLPLYAAFAPDPEVFLKNRASGDTA